MGELANVTIRADSATVFAAIRGEIDLSNADALERSIVESVPNTASGIVIDMSETSYIDSSGIRLLLAVASRARSRGQRMLVVAPEGSRARRVFAVAGVMDALAVTASVDSARLNLVPDGDIDP